MGSKHRDDDATAVMHRQRARRRCTARASPRAASRVRGSQVSEGIPYDVVQIALDKVEGFPFERFANAFYGALTGINFVPAGGVRDGGADARDGSIFEDGSRSGAFYQASVEVDAESKIRRTVKRLREFGRDPKTLTYLTSRSVKYSDRLERSLTDDLDVTVVIRDGGYIALHVNSDARTIGAFNEHLRHYTDFLRKMGASPLISASAHVRSPAVYVFLANEIERREGNESLVDSVTDALALWALEGTDPDQGLVRTADDVLARIVKDLPSVKELVAPRLKQRLKAMGKKEYPGGRSVRWHRKDDAFCLPFETRQRIEEENTADEALRLRIRESLDVRLRDAPVEGLGEVGISNAADVAMRTLQLAFEREGLEFASFLQGATQGEYTITDSLRVALLEGGHTGKQGSLVGDGAYNILRGVLYDSRPEEREYLQRLARTYALLFTLNTEPRLLEYFQDMQGDFRLYIGTDQIVRALSERYVPEADRMTQNTILMAAQTGAKLILTEPVLGEVVSHLRLCDHEHEEQINAIEHRLTYDFAREVPHIMLRAYLYARLNPNLGKQQPRSWPAFVNQFCSHSTLHSSIAVDDVRQYLQTKFGLAYESAEDLDRLVDEQQVLDLTKKLAEVKHTETLAHNDALLALAVYGRRKRGGETSRVTEFGWGTWWLTSETRIMSFTKDIVREHHARYIMRPDFLLNFMTLAPSALEARRAFASIFPSMLGISLAKRMKPADFTKIMDKVAEAEQFDEARRTVEMGKLVNQLKGDISRQYTTIGSTRDTAAVDAVAAREAGTEDAAPE